jgi:aspartate/methionine/tyrosine aminotransferase
LERSGIDYIAFGDTGKTWPTFEIKISPVTANAPIFSYLQSIYRDIFICTSPLAFVLLTEYIQVSRRVGIDKTVTMLVDTNRNLFLDAIREAPFHYMNAQDISVAWVKISDTSTLDDISLQKKLEHYRIHILPGRNFFWSRRHESTKFFRISLIRDNDVFSRGMEYLSQKLHLIMKKRYELKISILWGF